MSHVQLTRDYSDGEEMTNGERATAKKSAKIALNHIRNKKAGLRATVGILGVL